jgi:signal transduction histidine kinase
MDTVTEEREKKYIKFTNVIAVLTAIAVFLYIPSSILGGHYILGALQAIDVVSVLTVLWLNHIGYNTLSRHAYLLIINGFVLINSCFIGFDSHVHDFFYISYIVPFLMFGVKDYKNIVIGVLMAIGFFNIYEHIYPMYTQYNLDIPTQLGIYHINLWMKFVLFGLAIYMLSYYNYTAETELAATNRKLSMQADELRRSNEDLEQFASIISHDLKAPVRNVSSFMSLIMRRHEISLDPEILNFVELSKDSADRMARQIDDMLAYSKVGKNLTSSGSVDVNLVLKTIQIELGERIALSNTKINISQNIPVVRNVHSSMIHHIFQNLIANAMKFNDKLHPEISIDCRVADEQFVFEVRDNGIGINEVYAAKVFQMFKRLHTETEFEGTGIGLAVCKKIVNYYGGNIWFESRVGEGTSFYFTLPDKSPELSVVYTSRFAELGGKHALSLS